MYNVLFTLVDDLRTTVLHGSKMLQSLVTDKGINFLMRLKGSTNNKLKTITNKTTNHKKIVFYVRKSIQTKKDRIKLRGLMINKSLIQY